jgi:hypothetical protein
MHGSRRTDDIGSGKHDDSEMVIQQGQAARELKQNEIAGTVDMDKSAGFRVSLSVMLGHGE